MKSLLSDGIRTGELRVDSPHTEALARSVIGVQWIPENILPDLGAVRALTHSRDTVIRGVAIRPTD